MRGRGVVRFMLQRGPVIGAAGGLASHGHVITFARLLGRVLVSCECGELRDESSEHHAGMWARWHRRSVGLIR